MRSLHRASLAAALTLLVRNEPSVTVMIIVAFRELEVGRFVES